MFPVAIPTRRNCRLLAPRHSARTPICADGPHSALPSNGHRMAVKIKAPASPSATVSGVIVAMTSRGWLGSNHTGPILRRGLV